MPSTKADIIAQLQKDILPLQGFRHAVNSVAVDVGLDGINDSFPDASFPLGAIHEFTITAESGAATSGFMAGILGALMKNGGAILWISTARKIFPGALKSFGIEPDKIIFVDLQKEGEVLWAMEEALRCSGLTAVVAELHDLDFTASRRLQLAVEQSRVTGFVLRRHAALLQPNACIARWKITSLPSVLSDNMPGIGFPRWKVELLKVRNGRTGTWQLEWAGGRFGHIYPSTTLLEISQKKTG